MIASMRASISKILTEQTLGRGLRLPFGRYTGVEFLGHLGGPRARELRQAFEGEEGLPGGVHRSSDACGREHGPEGERGRTIRNRRGRTSRQRGSGGDCVCRTHRRHIGNGDRDSDRTSARDLGGSNRQGCEFGQGLRAELRARDDVAPILVRDFG